MKKPRKPRPRKPKKPKVIRVGGAARPRGMFPVAARPVVPPHPRLPAAPVAQVANRRVEKGKPANNTTCDVFHNGNAPPAAADVSDVACALFARFREGGEASEGDATFRWTHILYVSKDVDIRDAYPDAPDSRVYVPDDTGTGFDIVFVEIVNRGEPSEYKRVYLDRRDPTWPTNQL